jgi:hypothetical protein
MNRATRPKIMPNMTSRMTVAVIEPSTSLKSTTGVSTSETATATPILNWGGKFALPKKGTIISTIPARSRMKRKFGK